MAIAAIPLAIPVNAKVNCDDLAEPQSHDRERIVITGTRSGEVLDDQPYAISVIGQEEIERELPRTVPEALNLLPGVLVQKTASGHGSPYIRGFTGNRTLLVIDGVRYNNATFRDGANEYFAQIDTFTIDQIELVAGPSSALFGSEAVGGVLNLTTRGTGVLDRTGRYLGGDQTVRASSGDRSLVSRTAVELGEGGQWGFRGGLTVREYGDVRAARLGRLLNTGYSENAFDARLDLALAPNWTATINHQSLWQDDVPRTHSTVFSVPFAGTRSGSDLQRDKDHARGLSYLKIRGASDRAWMKSLEVTWSYQSRKEEERRVRANGDVIDQSFVSDLFAASAIATAAIGGIDWTYGFDLSREQVDSARTDTDPAGGASIVRLQGPVGTDARYDQSGMFVRGVIDLSERMTLEAGVRLSLIQSSIGRFADPVSGNPRSLSQEWSDLSGSIRTSYAAEGHTVWLGFSRSFRAPNIADVSRFGRSRTNEIEVASLTLEPETFDTFELGYRGEMGALDLGLNAYTTRLNDYIATVPTGRIRDGLIEVARRNAAAGRVSGIEVSLGTDLGSGFALSWNATWLRGRLTAPTLGGPVEEPISRIQPLTSNVRFAWERSDIWAVGELTLTDRASDLSGGDLLDVERIPPNGTPGYALLNVRSGIRFGERLAVSLALNNLLNEAYRAHGSGNNEPGRHVTVGIRLEI